MNKFGAGKASILALVAVFSTSLFLLGRSFTSVRANHDPFGGVVQTSVRICHATGSGGYVSNSPNVSGSGGNLNLQGHEGSGIHVSDIIPPFHWSDNAGTYSYAGKNWDTTNQAIWNADCGNATPSPSPTGLSTGTPTTAPTATPTDAPTTSPTIDPCLDRQCETTTPTATPVETPIETSTPLSCPDGTHPDAAGRNCVPFNFGGPGGGGPGGAVLGASTGQVLGASTMAGAGSFAETLYLAIMGLGGTLSTAGYFLTKKASK